MTTRGWVALCAATALVGALPVATAGTAAAAVGVAGTFTPVAPARILDTRTGVGAPKAALPGNGTLTLAVAGRGGVPASGAGAVLLNLTVTAPQAAGFLTVFPHGAPRPVASTLNFATGQTVANSATVLLPAGGSLDVFNGAGRPAQVIADVAGYYAAGTASVPGAYHPLTPSRVLDTRTGTGAAAGALTAWHSVLVRLAGVGGVPASGVSAVVLNLTATAPTAAGQLSVWDAGPLDPTAVNVQFAAGQTIANQVVVPLGADGRIGVLNASTEGTVQVVADLAGYYLGGGTPGAAGTFQAVPPARILDTASQDGTAGTSVPAGGSVTVPVGGGNGVPASGVSAVAVGISVLDPGSTGHVTAYPSGSARPGTSNLNFAAHQSVANLAMVPVGADGRIVLATTSSAPLSLRAYVVGYVRGASPAALPTIATVAGSGRACGDGLPATQACLRLAPDNTGLARDTAGNLYLSQARAGQVRRVAPDGTIATIAGTGLNAALTGSIQDGRVLSGRCQVLGDGGPATRACLSLPTGLATDTAGNLYIADSGDSRVRRITPGGTISTVAGNGTYGFCGDGGPATAACLADPENIALDGGGNLYISDRNGGRIRKVTPAGVISTIAGTRTVPTFRPLPCASDGDGGPAAAACVNVPMGIAVDAAGTVYVFDGGTLRLRRIKAGTITSLTAAPTGGCPTDDNVPAAQACVPDVAGVAVDGDGQVLLADKFSVRVRLIRTDGVITTLAGNGSVEFCGDGGPATSACLGRLSGLTAAAGRVYLADQTRVRQIDGAHVIDTVAGNGSISACADTDAPHLCLSGPTGIAVGPTGEMFVADGADGLRAIAPGGATRVVVPGPSAPSGECAGTGDGGPPGAGCVFATSVTLAPSGDLYISDNTNARLRKLTPAGVLSTVAGTGSTGYCGDGGPANQACISPEAAAVDAAGTIYLADAFHDTIRRIGTDGVITRYAGLVPAPDGTPCSFNGDGASPPGTPALQACLGGLESVAVSPQGAVYYTESTAHRVSRVDASGVVRTVAGNGTGASCGDGGPAAAACLHFPRALAFDRAGGLLISADVQLRRVDPAGTISTVLASRDGEDCLFNFLTESGCVRPGALTVDSAGRILFLPVGQGLVRALTLPT